MLDFDLLCVLKGHEGQKGQISENVGNGLKHVENFFYEKNSPLNLIFEANSALFLS